MIKLFGSSKATKCLCLLWLTGMLVLHFRDYVMENRIITVKTPGTTNGPIQNQIKTVFHVRPRSNVPIRLPNVVSQCSNGKPRAANISQSIPIRYINQQSLKVCIFFMARYCLCQMVKSVCMCFYSSFIKSYGVCGCVPYW